MDELRRALQAGDPLRHDSRLDPDDVERIRRAIMAAAEPSSRGSRAMAFAMVTSLCAVAAAGAWVVRSPHPNPAPPPPAAASTTPVDRPQSRRQLQFSTSGGTRVIWTFDSHFDRGKDQ
jgi:hypothetical protein